MKSIILNTEEVQDTLGGRKTQFRRYCKILNEAIFIHAGCYGHRLFPKYKAGNILYVKEIFCKLYENGKEIIAFKNDSRFDYIDTSVKWKPAMYLPEKHSRIFLKITNVRVERLQDISKTPSGKDFHNEGYLKFYCNKNPMDWFINIWNKKAKKDYKWKDNPYVFIYEFEMIFSLLGL